MYKFLSVDTNERIQAAGFLYRLANGVELPIAISLVNLTNDEAGHAGVVLGKIEAANLCSAVHVNKADERITDHAEVLVAGTSIIDVDNKHHFLDVGRNHVQIYHNLLVITVTSAGQVIALRVIAPL